MKKLLLVSLFTVSSIWAMEESEERLVKRQRIDCENVEGDSSDVVKSKTPKSLLRLCKIKVTDILATNDPEKSEVSAQLFNCITDLGEDEVYTPMIFDELINRNKITLLNKCKPFRATELKGHKGHTSIILSVAVSPDGNYALTGSADNKAILWHIDIEQNKFEKIAELGGHNNAVSCVNFSADGRFILTGSENNTAILWDRTTLKPIVKLVGNEDEFNCIQFSTKGDYVLTALSDNSAILWKINSNDKTVNRVATLTGHSRPIAKIAFSPDGNYFLTGALDGTVILWSTETLEKIKTFQCEEVITGLNFSPNGKYVLACTSSGNAHLFNLKNLGKEIVAFRVDAAAQACFSLDSKYIIIGGLHGVIRFYDKNNLAKLIDINNPEHAITSISISPDGKYLLFGRTNASTVILDLRLPTLTFKELVKLLKDAKKN